MRRIILMRKVVALFCNKDFSPRIKSWFIYVIINWSFNAKKKDTDYSKRFKERRG